MFDIKRPTKTVDIVTDLDTLAQAVDLKQQIDDATPNTAGMTDAEICAAKKATDKLRRELKTKLKTIDEAGGARAEPASDVDDQLQRGPRFAG